MPFPWNDDDEQPLDANKPGHGGKCAVILFTFVGLGTLLSGMIFNVLT